ncbi:MAG: hypothetical protein IPP32_14400 [Bacteroidetes bacterium]|nr:hypothetical protein [Bacteroidota bacterium]
MPNSNSLPTEILELNVKSDNEFGCRQSDFIQTVEKARANGLAIIGGQVQYVFTDGTCELYWLTYDSEAQKANEDRRGYCERTAKETIEKFNLLIKTKDFESEALENFEFIRDKKQNGLNLNDHLTFVIYFESASHPE